MAAIVLKLWHSGTVSGNDGGRSDCQLRAKPRRGKKQRENYVKVASVRTSNSQGCRFHARWQ